MTERFWGIDFSGGAAPWRERVRNPSVWLAEAMLSENVLSLADLQPVQALPGDGTPFDRLVALLSRGEYAAAAIDAPFSIPAAHLPQNSHRALLEYVRGLPNGKGKPFPAGPALIEMARDVRQFASKKPLRRCEQHWRGKGLNTRSTLWQQPRGGAPFASACLTLIAKSERPCWPWYPNMHGVLVEAFPAAQLRQWKLPHQGYNGAKGANARAKIVRNLSQRIVFSEDHGVAMRASADALDAVLAIFAGLAAYNTDFIPDHDEEGWISVHE